MSHFLPTFWTYLRWSLEFLYETPFVFGTLLLGVNLIASVIVQRPFQKGTWKKICELTLVQFIFFPAVLALAVIGRVDWQQPHFPGPNKLALRIEDGLDVGSLLLGIYLIWQAKGARWFALSIVLLQLWLLEAAGFIAAMSLTGTWL